MPFAYYSLLMGQLNILVDGKKKKVEAGIPLYSLFEHDEDDANPIVGAKSDCIAKSLRERVLNDGKIESIRLNSKEGRRIYRKTLCFLLSYASSVVAPERTLIIGHSLGDGYYFRYRNDEKPDKEKLESVMRKAVKEDFPVEIVTLSSSDALSYAKKRGLIETEELLETRNDSHYVFGLIDGCLEVYYEPLLPSLRYLSVWQLREYEGGLLLRYPRSESPELIVPFTDNPLLFSVFKRNKEDAEVLGVSSLGQLNKKVENGEIGETIRLSEYLSRRKISDAAEEIKKRKTVKAVFISGPSSSGKTTAALKISDELRIRGYNPIKISLDDYYHSLEKTPKDENGNIDFESPEALNIELFRKQIKDLLSGKSVRLPSHDFKTKHTVFDKDPIALSEKDILVIEGLHANNPSFFPDMPRQMGFKIYISALTQLNLDSRSRISTTDNRILRRIVRDNRTRGSDATETLSMWKSVEKGEKKYIFPYQNTADIMINSALDYELGVLALYALPLLHSVKKENAESYTIARRLVRFLSLVHPIPDTLVPPDSIIREFIGGSIYNAI